METPLTPGQAWQDFYAYMKESKSRIPGDVQEAQYAFDNRRKSALGPVRIMRLLEKHTPGRYKIELNFIRLK